MSLSTLPWKTIKFLTDPEQGFFKYLVKSYLLAFIPAQVLALFISFMNIDGSNSDDYLLDQSEQILEIVAEFVFIAPIIETILMALFITAISLIIKNVYTVSFITALIAGLIHSLFIPFWGIHTFWPFFIFSMAFLTWRRISFIKGFFMANAIHLLYNIVPTIAIILDTLEPPG